MNNLGPRLEERVTLITGAARGIGQMCLVPLARVEARIAVCDGVPMGKTIEMVKGIDTYCTSEGEPTSIHKEGLTSNVTRSVGGKVNGSPNNFFGFAKPPHGGPSKKTF